MPDYSHITRMNFLFAGAKNLNSNLNEIGKSEQKSRADADSKGMIYGPVIPNSVEKSTGTC